jgi:hypothetical protein
LCKNKEGLPLVFRPLSGGHGHLSLLVKMP